MAYCPFVLLFAAATLGSASLSLPLQPVSDDAKSAPVSDAIKHPLNMFTPYALKVDLHSITVAWKAPLQTEQSKVMTYELQMKSQNDEEWQQVYIGKDDKYEAKGLLPSTQYMFQTYAKGDDDFGPASSPLYVSTGIPPDAPKVFNYNLRAVETGYRHTRLAWNAPANSSSFVVEIRVDASNKTIAPVDWKHGQTVKAPVATFNNLYPQTVYTFRVYATTEPDPRVKEQTVTIVTGVAPIVPGVLVETKQKFVPEEVDIQPLKPLPQFDAALNHILPAGTVQVQKPPSMIPAPERMTPSALITPTPTP